MVNNYRPHTHMVMGQYKYIKSSQVHRPYNRGNVTNALHMSPVIVHRLIVGQ